MLVQVPDVSGIQQPARNVTRQLPKSGLLASEQLGPPSVPLELAADEEEDVDVDEVEDAVEDDEEVEDACSPPEPEVVLADEPPPVPGEPPEEPHAAQAAAIAAKRNHERRIGEPPR